ncbi:protoporphyrinogen oxidase [Actinobacteria bacterium YIM 96077]|uniref:Coproporphyrinogen III oxidase n=1 Tax=Phytoactinopolyspora halophila TaxID=1981511 RepID=A0A329R2Y6_9ACTN|nr:protoporphyrinogen oxidase [Phytoactinopolyspora halophila]AYY13407.1 protoporphyrinogen oxidase [Actinobacteria bacterium YIM 96077]RAW17358.1 protoporphyrinogen oxidase [Phytoactinopolyspora halophila]
MTRAPRVAVIGGGISGLAAAWSLRRELAGHAGQDGHADQAWEGDQAEITLFEQRRMLGGHLRVSDVAGLPVDEGAESVLARRPEAVDLARDVGLGDDLVHPAPVGAGIWSRGSIHPMPASTVMGVPADPVALSGLLTGAEVATVAGTDDAAVPGMPIEADVSIGRLVASRMGRAVVQRLVEPLLGGVYAGHADELSLDATVPALGAAARQHPTLREAVQSVRESAPAPDGPVFAGIDGGVGRLPEAVARAAEADVRTGVTVRELQRDGTGWRLVTGPVPAPDIFHADAVILAVPPVPAARLLRGHADATAAELDGIESASMAVVTLALPQSAFPEPPASSGFLVPPAEGRTIKAVTYSSVKWPWLGQRAGDLVVLRASIGRHRDAATLQRDDTELVDAVLADLHDAVGVRGRPIDSRVTRWGGAVPQYTVGHVQRVERIRAGVSQLPGLDVCGAAYDGVGIAACVGTAGAAARRVADDVRSSRVRIGT